ncbi:MAG: hypothetical protein ACYC4R_02430 [Anaerolineae bacterium]
MRRKHIKIMLSVLAGLLGCCGLVYVGLAGRDGLDWTWRIWPVARNRAKAPRV